MKKPLLFPFSKHWLVDGFQRLSLLPFFILGMVANSFAQAPGGVTGASVWLKANVGTSTTTDGSTIATWNDQSGNSRTHTQPHGTVYQPLYKDNIFNYNPAVYFDGLDGMQTPSFASGTDAVHVFAMSKVKDNGWRSIYGFGRDATHVQWYNNTPSWWLYGNSFPSTALGVNYGVTSFVMPKDGSQKTIHWNGTSANVTGINNYTFNSTLMGVGTDLNNFGNFSENFYGEIAEVIIYKKAGGGNMNTVDIQKIQSYLGIKYGVTLSHNYLDAAGATIYTLGTYNKNVFGIARDDAQGLYQKQSKSYDANAYVTLSTGAITTSNANNTGTLTNSTFEMVGDNGLDMSYGVNYAPSTFTPTTAFYRMSRVWQVQETGTVGTVRITVPTGADRLLVSNSASFTPGASTQELTFTADANGQYVEVDLNNTTAKFFTFGKSVGAPGCVAGGLNLWLKADFGTNTTTDGVDVLNWQDASGNENNHSKLSTSGLAVSPEFKANSGFNFNPSIYFDGGYNAMGAPRFASGTDSLVVFAVTRADNDTHWGAIYSFARDATHPAWYFGTPSVWLGANYNPLNAAGPNLNILYGINTFNLKRGAAFATSQDMWWNGNKTTYTGNGSYNYNATNFWLGNDVTNDGLASSEMFKGDFMEIAVYKNSSMTDAKIRKVQSYFGIKYGITVAHDYISGTDLNVWNRTTNTGYNNNIFGMGRDDCQDLNQKQSRSYTDNFLTIGNNGTIAALNASNSSAFSADKSFEIIGDNGLGKDYAVSYTPTSFTPPAPFSRMNRVWKVQETGTVGSIRVSVPKGAEYLLVHNTATFGAGTQEYKLVPDANGNVYADVNLTNGQFFTFGAAIKGPGCVNANIKVWLKADGIVTQSSGKVSDWTSSTASGLNVTQSTSTLQPGFNANAMNFNPSLDFDGGDLLVNSAIGTSVYSTAADPSTIFSVSSNRSTNATWNAFVNFDGADGLPTPAFHWKGGKLNTYVTGIDLPDDSHTATIPLNTPTIGYTRIENSATAGANGNVKIGYNGLSTEQTFAHNDISSPSGQLTMSVGGENTGAPGEFINALMPELVVYNRILTNDEVKRVNTYFGIKYGITVTDDYIAGDGTTKIWDRTANSAYNNNLLGIGRDDCQDLNQKQSKSVNSDGLITLGIDNLIATTNATNTGVFDADKSFLVMGDNGAATGTLTTVTPGGACTPPETVDKFTSRIWKSVESGSVESTKLSVDLSSYGFSTVNPVYMQVSSDAAFTSFSNILMVKNGVNYETNYDFAGTSAAPPANACSGDKTYEWNTFPSYWTWGQMSRTSTFGDTQFAVTITDPNGAIYAPSVYPVGQWWWNHIFIPRYDSNGSSNKITTKIVMDKAANKASFEIFDIDEYFGKDVVNVYGRLGGVQVNPKITFPTTTKLTSVISGTGAKISATTGAWDISAYGKAFVNFNNPVDEIIIEYTKDNGWAFKSYQDIRIRNIDIICKPFAPEVPLADNVYMSKQVVGGTSQKVDEAFTYKLTLTNLDCGNKTINILDGLPSGLTFVDSTLSTSLASTSVNTYGGTSSLNMTGVVVPPGTSYIYIDAKGSTAGSYDNQVDFSVGANSYLSDDPAQVGASNATPVTLVANRPLANLTITKSVDKATAAQNEVVKYTYVITNPNASAILTTFQDNLPASTAGGPFKYVAGTLTGVGAAIVTPAVYGGESSLTLRNLSIPANGSLTVTVDANTSTFTSGQTGKNVASVTPDPGTIYRDIPYYSGQANTLIGACNAGTTAPTLSATSKTNTCPTTTVDLNTLVTSSCPVGSTLEWHNVSTGLSASTKVTNPVSAAGTYYPTCFDATNACYSIVPATGVTVTITSCGGVIFTGSGVSSGTVSQTATPSEAKSGNAGTDLLPSGGTGPYTYSNGSADPLCVAPSGATALPPASNLIVNANGSYSYTAPSTPGTYYFCVKVCDSTSPTPICAIAVYKITVAATCAAGSAIPVLKN